MGKEETILRMKEISAKLEEASRAYYQDAAEIMSNFEYDALYDELVALEKESGIVLAGSPTMKVGYEVVSELPKEHHPSRMLSLDKTKEPEALASWLGDKKGILSWKMDGLTVVLTYEGGKLVKALTRGNGDIGEVITQNAMTFENLPLVIPYTGRLVIRGEAVIKYSDFEKINAMIPEAEGKYKNPRNLCSGSVRQLDPAVTKSRHVNVFIFALVSAEGGEKGDDASLPEDSREKQFEALKEMGFTVVDYRVINGGGEIAGAVEKFSEEVATNDFPSDGLVLVYDDIAYGRSLGVTAKFPRDAIAFKWRDEVKETVLTEIEWSASRTGLINPVAIFEPVELEGTTVSRASVHNVSIVKELALGIGDHIEVYKANMIIPQIAQNLTRSGSCEIPGECPVCGGKTEVRREQDAETLVCLNPECLAKHSGSIVHMASRDALNIEGMSEATVEKFIDCGIIREPADLFKLADHREQIVNMEGFGEKSFNNMVEAAEKASHTTTARFLYALGIDGIGAANAKVISRYCGHKWNKIRALSREELTEIEGVGDVLAASFADYFADEGNAARLARLLEVVTFEEVAESGAPQDLEGKTFVITGSLNGFSNRKELQALIEDRGGKVAGSVSAKTSYLINNDNTSGSTKNKTAQKLGVPIITEAEFMSMFGTPGPAADTAGENAAEEVAASGDASAVTAAGDAAEAATFAPEDAQVRWNI